MFIDASLLYLVKTIRSFIDLNPIGYVINTNTRVISDYRPLCICPSLVCYYDNNIMSTSISSTTLRPGVRFRFNQTKENPGRIIPKRESQTCEKHGISTTYEVST